MLCSSESVRLCRLVRRPRVRGQGSELPPLENYKNIGFLSNTCPDLEKSQSYHIRIQSWAITGTPAKRHLNGVSLAGRCWPAFSGIWLPPTKRKVGPPLKKLSGYAHEARHKSNVLAHIVATQK